MVRCGDGTFRDGQLDAQGRARLTSIPPGDAKVYFPEHGTDVHPGDHQIEPGSGDWTGGH